MNVCKQRPESLPPLDAIGLEPGKPGAAPSYPGGARQGGRRVGAMGMSSAPTFQRQASNGLGLGNVSQLAQGGFSMGAFQAPPSRLGDSQSRFKASSARGRGGLIPFPPGATGRLTPMTRSANQDGVGGHGGPRETKRTRAQRGKTRAPRASSSANMLTTLGAVGIDGPPPNESAATSTGARNQNANVGLGPGCRDPFVSLFSGYSLCSGYVVRCLIVI
jgi:translation initiation factor 4G